MIGSDQHYPEPKDADKRWQETILLFNQLPAEVRKKIGTENVAPSLRKFRGAVLTRREELNYWIGIEELETDESP